MTDDAMEDMSLLAAQIPLSEQLVDKLGDSADDYAMALWATAQHTDADSDEMASLIREVDDEYGVTQPDVIIDKWQEIFRSSGGRLSVICEDRVLAGAVSDTNAFEEPHASSGPSIEQHTDD